VFDDVIQRTIQSASLVVALLALVRVMLTARRIKRAWLSAFPLWLLLAHIVVYYILMFRCGAVVCQVPGDFFSDWSSVIRFHAVVTILFLPLGNLIGPIGGGGHLANR